MNINLNRIDSQADRPSIRISYDSCTQAHLVHRDFHGPFGTLVRVCLLNIPDESHRTVQHYLDLLCALGNNIGGYVRLRYDAESRHLIRSIGNALQEYYETNRQGYNQDLWPSPADPCLPDTLPGPVETQQVCLTRGNEPREDRPGDPWLDASLGEPYNIPGHAM